MRVDMICPACQKEQELVVDNIYHLDHLLEKGLNCSCGDCFIPKNDYRPCTTVHAAVPGVSKISPRIQKDLDDALRENDYLDWKSKNDPVWIKRGDDIKRHYEGTQNDMDKAK